MKYKRVVGYGANDGFVIFELKNGIYAVVSCTGEEDDLMYYGSWMSAAKFVPVYVTDDVPHELLRKAAHLLDVTEEGGAGYESTTMKLKSGRYEDLRDTEKEIEQEYRNSGKPVVV